MRWKLNYFLYLLVIFLFAILVLAVLLNPVTENRYPYNTTHTYIHSVNFSYNVTDPTVGGTIINCSLFLKHSYAGTWERNKTRAPAGGITQGIKNDTFNLTMLHENVYWKTGCYDNDSVQSNSSIFNFTIYDKDLTIEITFPKNTTHTYVHSVNFTYNATSSTYINISNCSLFLKHSYAGTWERNKTDAGVIEKLVNQTFNLTMLHENVYWKTGCYSNLSEQYNSSTFNFTIYDKTAAVKNRQPYNDTSSTTHATSFIYNVSLAEPSYVSISNCSLYLNNGTWYVNTTDTSITLDINQSINITLMHQTVKWKIGCYTNLSEQYNSSAFNYTVLEETVSGGGSSPRLSTSKSYALITPDLTKIIEFNNPNIPIISIESKLKKEAQLQLDIKKIMESFVNQKLENAYSYFEITSNLDASYFDNIKINFKVKKGYEDVSLYQLFDQGPYKVSITKLYQDKDYEYYQAYIYSLGYFGITAKPIEKEVSTLLTGRVVDDIEKIKIDSSIIGGFLVLVLIISIFIYILPSWKKYKK